VLSPAGIEAARHAFTLHGQERRQRWQALEDQGAQLRYEAGRAERRYEQVDPENRLVAEELERRWNESLGLLTEHESRMRAAAKSMEESDGEQRLAELEALGAAFGRVWFHPKADMSLKKQIVRVLVEEVMVDIGRDGSEVIGLVHWRGGCHSEVRLPRMTGKAPTLDRDRLAAGIGQLAAVMDDARIAAALNRASIPRDGASGAWSGTAVQALRRRRGIAAFDPEAKERCGVLLQQEAATKLGISAMSVHRLIKECVMASEQLYPGLPRLIRLEELQSEAVKRAVASIKQGAKRPLPEDQNQLSLW
jgi:hypothetical protein